MKWPMSLRKKEDEVFKRIDAILESAMKVKEDADRANYWRQRAKSAEGHLFASDLDAAARELHKRSLLAGTPFDDLTAADRIARYAAANSVIVCINSRRDERKPKDQT